MDRIEITLNGQPRQIGGVLPHTTLLGWLRSQGLTGSKEGCAEYVADRHRDDALIDEFADAEGCTAFHHADGDHKEVCDTVLISQHNEYPVRAEGC